MPRPMPVSAPGLKDGNIWLGDLKNGDALKGLLSRGCYALFKSPGKWTITQRQRAEPMLRLYPAE